MQSKFLAVAIVLAASIQAKAAETTYLVDGKTATPLEATIAALQSKDAKVFKCQAMVVKTNSKSGTVGLTHKAD